MAGYDLEKRTLLFSQRIIKMAQVLPKNCINLPLISQVIRSATSIGANYREANESLSKKDFLMRAKIARKEAKETMYWLEILIKANIILAEDIGRLLQEVIELKKILSSIITNSTTKKA